MIMKKRYDRTYYVYHKNDLIGTCKTRRTANKIVERYELLWWPLVPDVRIDCLSIERVTN